MSLHFTKQVPVSTISQSRIQTYVFDESQTDDWIRKGLRKLKKVLV